LTDPKRPIAFRFRGYLPVVIDLETGGFNSATDALLEIAATIIDMNDEGQLVRGETIFHNVEPFKGANIEQASLDFTGIDPDNPLRMAIPEKDALMDVFQGVRRAVRETGCQRAILVAHNAAFDQGFLNRASDRCNIKRNPFHPFSSFDTATLCGLAYRQTVLARACEVAGISFDADEAHSALYDCEKTADIFCSIVNKWKELGGLMQH
jgi:ribonuclease T|tara:strand:- start:118 stop:744 length:627 start_codon:yes stop_codon:yes gene_type:complete